MLKVWISPGLPTGISPGSVRNYSSANAGYAISYVNTICFSLSSTSIIRKRNGKMKRRKFDRLKSVIFSDMEGVTDFWCIELI